MVNREVLERLLEFRRKRLENQPDVFNRFEILPGDILQPSLRELSERHPPREENKMNSKSFKIDFESMSEEDLNVIKSPPFFLHDDFGIAYVEIHYLRSYYPTFVFNKETLQAIVDFIKKGSTVDSQEIKELLSQKVDEECFDLKKSSLDSRRNKKLSYASKTWDNKKSQIIEEGEDYYIMGNVPNGETADGRARTYKVYKSLEAVKKDALEYIESEIEIFQKLKEQIEEEE